MGLCRLFGGRVVTKRSGAFGATTSGMRVEIEAVSSGSWVAGGSGGVSWWCCDGLAERAMEDGGKFSSKRMGELFGGAVTC